MKLEEWQKAIDDCTSALSEDQTSTVASKAYWRRHIGLRNTLQFQNALDDLKILESWKSKSVYPCGILRNEINDAIGTF